MNGRKIAVLGWLALAIAGIITAVTYNVLPGVVMVFVGLWEAVVLFFTEDEDDVKLDAWMWWTIAIGTIITGVVTFFVVRALGNLLAVANVF